MLEANWKRQWKTGNVSEMNGVLPRSLALFCSVYVAKGAETESVAARRVYVAIHLQL